MPPRFLEIDLLRGVAVVLMVLYHFLFDWNFFVYPIVDLHQGFWFYLGRTTAVVFVGLAGLSFMLSAHRSTRATVERWRVLMRRGIFILGLGMGISLITYLTFPAYAIWFGVLHLLGVSMLAGTFLLHRRALTLGLGGLLTFAGVAASTVYFSILPYWPILLPVSFQTFDYFPILPWMGIFFLGMSAGNYFYPKGIPHRRLGWARDTQLISFFSWLGKKSLLIYFVHQPILLSVLWAMGKISV